MVEMPVDDRMLVRVLKALADQRRFRMVQEIAVVGELSCGQIAERFDVSQPTISHHLKILTEAQILLVRREGQHGFITVNHELVSRAMALLPRRLSSAARVTPKRLQPKPHARQRAR
jgi:ArsR family transcriptional regulator, arsenate/arsenite/antimonite-responsive transcriptional repressor